jgi:hypothetical protein
LKKALSDRDFGIREFLQTIVSHSMSSNSFDNIDPDESISQVEPSQTGCSSSEISLFHNSKSLPFPENLLRIEKDPVTLARVKNIMDSFEGETFNESQGREIGKKV